MKFGWLGGGEDDEYNEIVWGDIQYTCDAGCILLRSGAIWQSLAQLNLAMIGDRKTNQLCGKHCLVTISGVFQSKNCDKELLPGLGLAPDSFMGSLIY